MRIVDFYKRFPDEDSCKQEPIQLLLNQWLPLSTINHQNSIGRREESNGNVKNVDFERPLNLEL
jgi:hypothetical protein